MTSPSFPAALDALANPGPTTETDDAGFELDIVVARLQNCVMALEGKLGIGAGGPPGSAAVLRRTATGASAWDQVQGGDIRSATIPGSAIGANEIGVRRLFYVQTADVYTGSSLGATLSTDLIPAQSFTVDSTSSVVGVSAIGSLQCSAASAGAPAQIRVHVDATIVPIGGGVAAVAAGLFIVQGAGTVWLTGLAAGSHTVKLSVLAGGANLSAVYFRPASVPIIEFASVSVAEVKR